MSKTLRELTLALATVTGDLYHVSGGDLLDKRITIDDITTAVRETLKGALVADGNMTIETGGLLLARSNEDVIQEIGRVKVWGASDIAYVSHYDFATAAGAGWQQNASGDSYLNGASGRTAGLRIANGDILTVTGTLISLKKATTIAGDFTQTTGVTSLKATTITGTLTAVGDITQTSGVITARAGSSVIHTMGASFIGGIVGIASFGYHNLLTAESRALGINSSGLVILNAQTGADIHFRKNNSIVGSISDTAFNFGMTTLINGAVDNTIDDLQVEGSIYASTTVKALGSVLVGLTYQSLLDTTSLRLGLNSVGDTTTFIDFHGASGSTYDSRLRRYTGVNGDFDIIQRGTGTLNIQSLDNATIALRGSADYATFSNTAITLEKPVTATLGIIPSLILHGTYSEAQIFTAMSPFVPNIGDEIKASGSFGEDFNPNSTLYTVSYIKRTTSTRISVYCVALTAGATLTLFAFSMDSTDTLVDIITSITL